MLSRYDTTQQARVDCEFARKYDTTQNAFVDCEFVRSYDTATAAWVDKLKKLMEVSVGSGFYDNSGNQIFLSDTIFHCDVRPSSNTYSVEFVLEDDFTNPAIECEYSFGHSDLCPNIAADFRSHAVVDWEVKGYLNGAEVASEGVAMGSSYAYATIFDEPVSVILNGTFDEIRLVCVVNSFSNYSNYNRANTTIDNFSIDGKKYSAKAQVINS